MEVLAARYWFEIEPFETAEPTEEPLPNGSAPGGVADPTPDADFLEVSEMIQEGEISRDETEEEKKGGEVKNGSSEQSETVSDVIPYLENISVQLGVIDLVIVLLLLLYVIKQFIRVPR